MERIRADRTGHSVTLTTKYFGAYQLRRALYHDAFKIMFACDRKEEEYDEYDVHYNFTGVLYDSRDKVHINENVIKLLD